jgi:hypothetical protein
MLNFDKKFILFKPRRTGDRFSFDYRFSLVTVLFKHYLNENIIILPVNFNKPKLVNVNYNYQILIKDNSENFINLDLIEKIANDKIKLFIVGFGIKIPIEYKDQCQCIEYDVSDEKIILYENWSVIKEFNFDFDYNNFNIDKEIIRINRKQIIELL